METRVRLGSLILCIVAALAIYFPEEAEAALSENKSGNLFNIIFPVLCSHARTVAQCTFFFERPVPRTTCRRRSFTLEHPKCETFSRLARHELSFNQPPCSPSTCTPPFHSTSQHNCATDLGSRILVGTYGLNLKYHSHQYQICQLPG